MSAQRKLVLSILVLLFILCIGGVGYWYYVIPISFKNISILGMSDFNIEDYCSKYQCVLDEEGKKIKYSLKVISYKSLEKGRVELNCLDWNKNTNEYEMFNIVMPEYYLVNIDKDNNYRTLEIEAKLKKRPNLVIGERDFLKSWLSTEFVVYDMTDKYFDYNNLIKEGELDYDVQEELKSSLSKENCGLSGSSIVEKVYLFENTPSYKYLEAFFDYNWECAFDFDIQQPSFELDFFTEDCKLLKRYFPNENCVKPLDKGLFDGIYEKNYKIVEMHLVLKATDKNIEKLLLGNYQREEELKSRFARKLVNNYARSLVEYIYFSGGSCKDSIYTNFCEDIYSLYNYGKILSLTGSEYGFCSQISILPLFYKITEDPRLQDELNYIISNYFFKDECTFSGGAKGLCTFDLEERYSCMEFLSDSLVYYMYDSNVEKDLKYLALDTYLFYKDLENNGVWGREDINLLNSGQLGREIYPVKYYDFKTNFFIYKIFENNVQN